MSTSTKMSRAAMSKSRADKTRGASQPQPVVTNDVVPGRFTEPDWTGLLDREDGEEFIMDCVEEVVNSAMDEIYRRYIQKQLLPYTVIQAKDAILQIIEWQFLARDEGEGEVLQDPSWEEDDEPLPPVTDSWAQGSVPTRTKPEPATSDKSDSRPASQAGSRPGSATQEKQPEVETTVEVKQEPKEAVKEKPKTEVQKKKPVPPQKPKTKFKPHRGPLGTPGLKEMTKSLDETESEILRSEESMRFPPEPVESPLLKMPSSCHNILKVQAGRPPGNRDIVYDHEGRVINVIRINPDRLPTHRVKTQFQIVDPQLEKAQAHVMAVRAGKISSLKMKKKPTKLSTGYIVPGSSTEPATQARVHGVTAIHPSVRHSVITGTSAASTRKLPGELDDIEEVKAAPVTPLPPPLIESMEVSPGVTVREGSRIKKGPRQLPRKYDIITPTTQHALRPLTDSSKINPEVLVQEILARRSPILRPLSPSRPVPPIVPHPPNKQPGITTQD
ncbi:uncharacterized protein C2orf81 homolog isoform X1 [Branchiostoma floridae]|uniref:Uncharacterized protein C2orf81 homolog isoform X1 n=1 Tax=Branchiostoma floridae TaxID=7739 RepID=A0A9J7KWV0_BRAFL|nr:uncharacterized protein C2orf81 homolog isoform X1 [Branchiostoma floridae]